MKTIKAKKWLAALMLITLLGLVLASPAYAFEPLSGERVVIEEGQVIDDDVYVGANTFILKGTIKGDLLASGSVIVIYSTGVVEGDLLAAAQAVVINGTVEDDARIAGAVLSVGESGQVGGDLLAFGYSIEVADGSQVGGDVVVYGAQAVLAGDIAGDVQAGTGGLQVSGSIGGDVQAEVGGQEDIPPFNPFMFMPSPPEMPKVPVVPAGLTMGQEAVIGGGLKYTAPVEASIPSGVVAGGVKYQEPEIPAGEEAPPPPTTAQQIGKWSLKFLGNLASLLIVGLLMAWFTPDLMRNGALALRAKPLPSFLWGIVAYVAFFVALFIVIFVIVAVIIILGVISLGNLVSTSVGVGLVLVSSMMLAFNVSVSYVSKILVGYLVGQLLLARIKSDLAEGRFWPMLLGVVIFAILWSIPILGTIVNIVVILFGLGALWLVGQDWYSAMRADGEPAVEPVPAVN